MPKFSKELNPEQYTQPVNTGVADRSGEIIAKGIGAGLTYAADLRDESIKRDFTEQSVGVSEKHKAFNDAVAEARQGVSIDDQDSMDSFIKDYTRLSKGANTGALSKSAAATKQKVLVKDFSVKYPHLASDFRSLNSIFYGDYSSTGTGGGAGKTDPVIAALEGYASGIKSAYSQAAEAGVPIETAQAWIRHTKEQGFKNEVHNERIQAGTANFGNLDAIVSTGASDYVSFGSLEMQKAFKDGEVTGDSFDPIAWKARLKVGETRAKEGLTQAINAFQSKNGIITPTQRSQLEKRIEDGTKVLESIADSEDPLRQLKRMNDITAEKGIAEFNKRLPTIAAIAARFKDNPQMVNHFMFEFPQAIDDIKKTGGWELLESGCKAGNNKMCMTVQLLGFDMEMTRKALMSEGMDDNDRAIFMTNKYSASILKAHGIKFVESDVGEKTDPKAAEAQKNVFENTILNKESPLEDVNFLTSPGIVEKIVNNKDYQISTTNAADSRVPELRSIMDKLRDMGWELEFKDVPGRGYSTGRRSGQGKVRRTIAEVEDHINITKRAKSASTRKGVPGISTMNDLKEELNNYIILQKLYKPTGEVKSWVDSIIGSKEAELAKEETAPKKKVKKVTAEDLKKK